MTIYDLLGEELTADGISCPLVVKEVTSGSVTVTFEKRDVVINAADIDVQWRKVTNPDVLKRRDWVSVNAPPIGPNETKPDPSRWLITGKFFEPPPEFRERRAEYPVGLPEAPGWHVAGVDVSEPDPETGIVKVKLQDGVVLGRAPMTAVIFELDDGGNQMVNPLAGDFGPSVSEPPVRRLYEPENHQELVARGGRRLYEPEDPQELITRGGRSIYTTPRYRTEIRRNPVPEMTAEQDAEIRRQLQTFWDRKLDEFFGIPKDMIDWPKRKQSNGLIAFNGFSNRMQAGEDGIVKIALFDPKPEDLDPGAAHEPEHLVELTPYRIEAQSQRPGEVLFRTEVQLPQPMVVDAPGGKHLEIVPRLGAVSLRMPGGPEVVMSMDEILELHSMLEDLIRLDEDVS